MALSFSLGSQLEAQNLIFTFSDDGAGGTKVIASGGTATVVGVGGNTHIGVRSSIDFFSNTGFGFIDDAFPFGTFAALGVTLMSDSMTLVPGGGLASGQIYSSHFTGTVFSPLYLAPYAAVGATLSAVGAPDPVGTLGIPYSVFASLDGKIIVNSEDGWEFHFGAVAVEAPGVLRISSIRRFGRTVVGKKSRPQIVQITNIGQSEVNSISATISGRASGEFNATTAASSLAAGKSTSTKVTFEPKGKGKRSAKLNVSSSVGKQKLSLTGRAITPKGGGHQVLLPASYR